MGQGHSQEAPSIEVLSHRLTESFATKALTPFELYIFKAVFKEYAVTTSGLSHWPQSTLSSFLEIPENPGLPIAHVIFQLATYLGAFPFPSQAPAILTNESLLRVVVVLTGKYNKVIRGGRRMWEREIWRGLAVFDRALDQEQSLQATESEDPASESTGAKGFAVDAAIEPDDDDADEDEMFLAAFDAMDATDAFKHGEKASTQHAMVPTDNFMTFIMFMLLIAPLTPQERLPVYVDGLDEQLLQELRESANSILTSFGVESHPGISYRTFRSVVQNTVPHFLDPVKPLFEHFFYPPNFDLFKSRKPSVSSTVSHEPSSPYETKVDAPPRSVMPEFPSEILNRALLSQIAFILPPSTVFRNLTGLYSGNQSGFSMPTFQNSVFGWTSPTLMLVSGTLLPESLNSGSARSFVSSMPYRRFGSSAAPGQRVIFGAYIPVPWKQTHKSSFGSPETVLFQLYPQHDVFPTTGQNTALVYFNRNPSTFTGLGLGSPLAESNHSSGSVSGGMSRRASGLESEKIPLGPVSLHIDDSLTYAAFTHDSRGGGSFRQSQLPPFCRLSPSSTSSTASGTTPPPSVPSNPVASPPGSPVHTFKSPSAAITPSAPLADWQDIFEIDALEVYGLGGADILEEQKRAREWEEREAERRRTVQMRTGDIESDRELLKMAGLIGEGRSGGSMG